MHRRTWLNWPRIELIADIPMTLTHGLRSVGVPQGGDIEGYRLVKRIKFITAEAWLAGGLALLAILGVVFMSQLVAAPKVLFGRSLTAIPPSLFPSLVLGALAVLASGLIYTLRGSIFAEHSKTFEDGALPRVVMLFAVMLFYALTMAPFGFLISTALALSAVGWLAGNRSIVQILAVAIISPVVLYLITTRGLAVSLPELSSVEFFYARIIDMIIPTPCAGEACS